MAIAMGVVGGWRASDMEVTVISKKRSWGDDQQKLFDLMVGSSSRGDANTTHTLDLLGGSSTRLQAEFVELDTETPLPSGWEKRLDLKSGAVYFVNWTTGRSTTLDPRNPAFQEADSSISHEFLSSKHSEMMQQQQQQKILSDQIEGHDDSCTPTQTLPQLQEEQTIELNLKLSNSTDQLESSICTMEKVKQALARSQAQASYSLLDMTAASVDLHSTASPALSTSSSSSSSLSSKRARMKARDDDPPPGEKKPGLKGSDIEASSVTLTVCKNCFMYVMLSASDPRCPRCSSTVILDFPLEVRKSELELNL